MHSSSAYESLVAHMQRTIALEQVSGLLGWDQETQMPPRAAPGRAEQLAALEAVLHARRTDPAVGAWLDEIGDDVDTAAARANVTEARRRYDRACKLPEALVTELARVISTAQQVWMEARKENDVPKFAPHLARIVELKREQAKCLSDGDNLYQPLLEEFEPGAVVEDVADLLGRLRPRLSALIGRIGDAGEKGPRLSGRFGSDEQMKLARRMAEAMGYDFEGGRLDLSAHPFTSGYPGDVRITTRVDEQNPLDCLYSCIHEVGHALYEQGLPEEHVRTHAGEYASLGIHESQSRFWENQIGRSRPFCDWLHPAMTETFGDYGVSGPDELYRILNRARPSFIRTEADEVTYNLHILMRFELELALIEDRLQVTDIEEAWNSTFERDFGLTVPDPAHGVLQDIHWAAGILGYFPTYSLGNIYAAELDLALRKEMPDMDDRIARGDWKPILTWLRSRVHAHGRMLAPTALMEQVTGRQPSETALLDYLDAKFQALYP